MLCSFKKLIYPRTAIEARDNGYMVAVYKIHDRVPDAQGKLITEAKVVGNFLPTSTAVKFDIQGRWAKTKYGLQFELSSYKEVIQPTKDGIIAYLSSGLIKGVGKKIAEKIYGAFGTNTLNILDYTPEKLLAVKGISPAKLREIQESYIRYRDVRDIITLLGPHGITPKRAMDIYEGYGPDAVKLLRENPYKLCGIRGIGFHTADAIAQSAGVNQASADRIDAGIMHTLKEAEAGGELFKNNSGNLCIHRKLLTAKCFELLRTPQITLDRIVERIDRLIADHRIAAYEDRIYREHTEACERYIAGSVCNLLEMPAPFVRRERIEDEIAAAEKRLRIILATEQKSAVRTCLTSRITIITGGPGTGKTMLQRVLLDVYKRLHPGAKITCCAPTGRAARRMAESTEHPASTIHKTLGLYADDGTQTSEPERIEADLVLIDEVSMMDVYLTKNLFSALPENCQLVLVGDADQLPSVRPGAILSELIACERIPVITLEKVYRQSSGSRITVNAALIKHGTLALEEGDDFEIVESCDLTASAHILEKRYLDEVQQHGIDNVVLLSPYRTRTATGVNALNERLRDLVNPAASSKPEVRNGKQVFRLSDKVMQMQNSGEASNGDTGYIVGMFEEKDDTVVCVDFGDGRTVEYRSGDLDKLELAYATTVHKSQGSEYRTVLLNLQNAHAVMLKRPLLYTAITRAKEKVVIVGERQAICTAIKRVDTERRGTMLAKRIQSHLSMPLQKAQ